MRIFYLLLIFQLFAIRVVSQTFSGFGGAIPDNGTSVDFTINTSFLPASIDTLTFGIEEVCINIEHTWDSDLDITLIAPDGTQVLLTSGNGAGGDDFQGTCFRQDAANSIIQGNAPFAGTYRPQGQLGMLNNGQDPNGVWTLHINDTYPFADSGTLFWWTITFGNDPATAFTLTSSNLPIVLINTMGQSINQDPKITAWMGIIDNGPVIRNEVTDSANGYNGFIGIDLRGHSSLGFPQKQYGVETRDSLGNNLNASILGMPAENDWILYAPWNDKSLMRNALTYQLSNSMGRYASRGKYCEFVLNGEYKGVYTFFEKIKRDNNRVDISGLTLQDTSGMELTGGYICSLDWVDNGGWTSSYPPDPTWPTNNTIFYQYIYPKDSEILPQQADYIQQYVDSFETALLDPGFDDPVNGWRKFGDEGSFIDFFLVNEISKNVDGYRLSTFFHKNKNSNGGKLNMGPVWDFNLAWHNADYCDNQTITGWAYLFTDHCEFDFPFWWRRINEDSTFVNNTRCRWDDLRATVFDTTYIFNYIDSIALLLDESQQRHYYIYPVFGIYLWPNPNPLSQSYAEEISNLKNWIVQRINYMDANLPGTCTTTSLAYAGSNPGLVLSPNPATSNITITSSTRFNGELQILNNLGKVVKTINPGNHASITVNIQDLSPGVYIFHIPQLGKSTRFVKL